MTKEERLALLEDIINNNTEDKLKTKKTVIPPAPKKAPLISIVTIYDDENERKWLDSFIDNLPCLPPEQEGEIEVILCKNVRDKHTTEKPFPPIVREGVTIHSCLVYLDEWSFAEARQAARQAAAGKWILSLDTDEMILSKQVSELIKICKEADENVGGFQVRIYSPIGEENDYTLTQATRLFRNNPEIVWQCSIHETVSLSIQQNGLVSAGSNLVIFHDGYKVSETELLKKLRRNLKMICGELYKSKDSHIITFMENYLFATVGNINRITNTNNPKEI